jgi:CRISPR-associated protein Csm4
MTAIQIYRLTPRASFHFGVRGVGVEATGLTCHSDTLFSALCLMIRELRGEAALEEFLSAFATSAPPFLLSSAFPYVGEVALYPKPMSPIPIASGQEDDLSLLKTIKKIRFVSQPIFEAILASETLKAPGSDQLLQGKRVWITPQERQNLEPMATGGQIVIWEKDGVPRVAVDRVTSASAVYQAGQMRFNDGCGLHVLIRWRDESQRELIEEALRALGDVGIGGERSAGHGLFSLQDPQPVPLQEPERSARFVTLSLYHPTKAEVEAGERSVLGDASAYELVGRGGWMASPDEMARRRKRVNMLGEGAVLTNWEPDRVYGNLVDVTPERTEGWAPPHNVYRYGFAFPVGAAAAREDEG